MKIQEGCSGLENVATQVKSLDTETIKDGLQLLRKWKFPGIKGRWDKTLEKLASNLGKWTKGAGLALTALTSLYEIYSASSEQEKLNAEQRRQVLRVHQAIESVATQIAAAILEETRVVLDQITRQTLTSLDSRIDEMTADCEKHVRDREHVNRLVVRLDAVRV